VVRVAQGVRSGHAPEFAPGAGLVEESAPFEHPGGAVANEVAAAIVATIGGHRPVVDLRAAVGVDIAAPEGVEASAVIQAMPLLEVSRAIADEEVVRPRRRVPGTPQHLGRGILVDIPECDPRDAVLRIGDGPVLGPVSAVENVNRAPLPVAVEKLELRIAIGVENPHHGEVEDR